MTQPVSTALRALALAMLLSPAAAQAPGLESSITRLESLTASLVLESVWAIIALFGLWQALRSKRT